ncbi:putative membrane protein YeiB [Sphingomonas insulae]|nr:DUF418 domain-containing protein [Sphingomonas insulae]NIJ30926.1 putative membrane protein YeiB [Sphingomonas insulae]
MTLIAAEPPVSGEKPERMLALDVIRGVSLCGIAFVNIGPVTHFGSRLPPVPVTLHDASGWLQLFGQQRFFVIFSLLFGIGFTLLQESAIRQGHRNPRRLLARRLVTLLPLGAVHQIPHPGEALLPYAVAGLFVLLPSTWLSRNWLAMLTAIAVPAALALGGGLVLIPTVFLLGSTLVRWKILVQALLSRSAGLALLLVSSAVALPVLAIQVADISNSGFSVNSAVAGMAMAGVYIAMLLLAMQTRARRVIASVFGPLGRMALTNYVTATLLMHGSNAILHFPYTRSWSLLLGTTFAILSIQTLWSALWLRWFDHGPLEYLWRWSTWGRRPGFLSDRSRPTGRSATRFPL